jgi:selenocysteine-specific elongation factor
MEALLGFLRDHFAQHETIDLAAIKNFTGVTRKYLIPLMEYLDQNQWTIRDGDLRRKGPRL